MNLTLHLIKKDIYRNRWALSCWVLSLISPFLQTQVPMQSGNLRDYLQIAAMLAMLILSIGLIADFVQVDHPTQEDQHWRALPVSAGRMMMAKLLLIGTIFVVVPVAATCIYHVFDRGQSLHDASEYGLQGLTLAAIVLSLAATAACTKNVVHCLVLWLALIFGAGSLAELLNRFTPVLSRQITRQININVALTVLGFSAVTALGIILNQYLRRRLGASVALLIAGSVGSALVGTMWGYYYFYSSQ
ncbi:MAG TPA: hypothetical protein VIM71_03985 [Lacunisphaera sp.]